MPSFKIPVGAPFTACGFGLALVDAVLRAERRVIQALQRFLPCRVDMCACSTVCSARSIQTDSVHFTLNKQKTVNHFRPVIKAKLYAGVLPQRPPAVLCALYGVVTLNRALVIGGARTVLGGLGEIRQDMEADRHDDPDAHCRPDSVRDTRR